MIRTLGTSLLAISMIAGLVSMSYGQARADSPTPTAIATPTSDFTPPSDVSATTYTGPPTIEYIGRDTDGDGCSDRLEVGDNPNFGGRRDPLNPWDFYDVSSWDANRTVGGPPDGEVGFEDIVLVAFQFGSEKGDLLYDYRPSSDRANATDNPYDFANLGPPDWRIDWADLKAIFAQFGHGCGLATIKINVAKACNNVVMEVSEIDGNSSGCILERNTAGEIDDVKYVSVTQFGQIASNCVSGCGPPGWYTKTNSAKWEINWPLVDEICIRYVGCVSLGWIEVNLLRYEMRCTWNWLYAPGNIYNGATVDHDCSDRSFDAVGVYRLESQEAVAYATAPGTFKVTARSNGQIGVFSIGGVALRHFTVRLFCSMGPWDKSYCWATG